MHHNDPLEASLTVLKGYNDTCPLKEEELVHLYTCIAMRLIISVTKAAINKQKEPTNKYLLVSEESAWKVLKKWFVISPYLAEYSFRNSCGFCAHPNEDKFKNWISNQHFSLKDLFPSVSKNEIELLSVVNDFKKEERMKKGFISVQIRSTTKKASCKNYLRWVFRTSAFVHI